MVDCFKNCKQKKKKNIKVNGYDNWNYWEHFSNNDVFIGN